MLTDVLTVMRKEMLEILMPDGRLHGGARNVLILVAIAGVLFPLQAGASWLTSWLSVYSACFPAILVLNSPANPTGTVIEQTELKALRALEVIKGIVGPENVEITTDFVGVQPASYPINTIYLFTNGPQEAVLRVALKRETPLKGEDLRERLRRELRAALPDTAVSFEAPDIISQVMSFGSPTPIEVDVQGPNMSANQTHAARIYAEMQKIPEFRDLQYIQPLDYPTLDVKIDRDRAGQLGLTMADVARPLVTATSSSRFVAPNFWRDPKSGNAFQIQVQVPPHQMTTLQDVENIPIMPDGSSNRGGHPTVGDLAVAKYGTAPGEVDRYNMQRTITLAANARVMKAY